MNWTWNIRSGDAAMNGLEFARCTTAGELRRVLVHAAPGQAQIEVIAGERDLVAGGSVERQGEYSPMTLLELVGGEVRRTEIWPTGEHIGLPVLLAGGEAGILRAWENSPDHTWWRWSLEFSNHKGRPDDWSPADEAPS